MKNRFMRLIGLLVIMVIAVMPMVAQAQSLDLSGLVDDVFAQTNTWIPVFGPILAIGAGLTIAVVLIGMLLNRIISGIKSAGGK